MTLNLEQQTTYTVRQGLSLSGSQGSEDTQTTDTARKNEFHLLSRQLPRSTTKLSRELLDNGAGLRTRFSETGSNANDDGARKRAIMLEADSRDQKATCTYEGEFELIAPESPATEKPSAAGEGQEVECVLIYDEESKAFVIERVTSNTVVKSGVVNGVSAASGGAATGLLALPSKRHDPSRERSRGVGGAAAGGDAQTNMDVSSEDELAKELEGMLDDASDMGDPLSASSARQSQSRKSQAGSKQKQSSSWENIEDQLNMELAENLDEALLEDVAASDDDDFEEVDSAQFVSGKAAKSLGAEVESLADGPSDEEDDEMVFEEVDPSASIGVAASGGPQDKSHGSDLISDDDFEDFEEIGSPRTAQSSAFDEALFGGSVASTPPTGDSATHSANASGFSKPADGNAENADDFVDLEFD